jgi:hypothetical protein
MDQMNKMKMDILVLRRLNVQKEQFDATTPKNVFLYNMHVMETTIVAIFLMFGFF